MEFCIFMWREYRRLDNTLVELRYVLEALFLFLLPHFLGLFRAVYVLLPCLSLSCPSKQAWWDNTPIVPAEVGGSNWGASLRLDVVLGQSAARPYLKIKQLKRERR